MKDGRPTNRPSAGLNSGDDISHDLFRHLAAPEEWQHVAHPVPVSSNREPWTAILFFGCAASSFAT
jgi:hypothetical protein